MSRDLSRDLGRMPSRVCPFLAERQNYNVVARLLSFRNILNHINWCSEEWDMPKTPQSRKAVKNPSFARFLPKVFRLNDIINKVAILSIKLTLIFRWIWHKNEYKISLINKIIKLFQSHKILSSKIILSDMSSSTPNIMISWSFWQKVICLIFVSVG